MSSSAKLAYHVTVQDADGEQHTFGPDSDLPAWAKKAITNPSAWQGGAGPVSSSSSDAGDPDADQDEPYKGWLKADLEAEVAKRNVARDEDHQIQVGGTGKVDDLKAALVADDAAQA